LYAASQLSKETRPPFDILYWAQLVVLSLFGGVLAWVNHLTKPISALTAFNLGLSAPAILKAGADLRAKTTKKRKTDKDSRIN